MTEFTDNKQFMNNIVKFHSDLVQLLVQKYLEEEHTGVPVYMYPELINDIDVFNNRIEAINKIREKVVAVQAFLDIIQKREEYTYTNTYEVKYESHECAFKMKNIRQLIDNGVEYPTDTQVELILVPSDAIHLEQDDELYKNVETFNTLRSMYLELEEEQQKQIMDVICHDTGSLNKDANKVLHKLITTTVLPSYSEKINDNRFKCMHHNFSKLCIRVITMEELSKVSISTEYIMKLLFPFDLE